MKYQITSLKTAIWIFSPNTWDRTKLLKPFRILVLAPTLDTYLSLHWELAIRQVSVLLCITALSTRLLPVLYSIQLYCAIFIWCLKISTCQRYNKRALWTKIKNRLAPLWNRVWTSKWVKVEAHNHINDFARKHFMLWTN